MGVRWDFLVINEARDSCSEKRLAGRMAMVRENSFSREGIREPSGNFLGGEINRVFIEQDSRAQTLGKLTMALSNEGLTTPRWENRQ
jgi:hypothetical protein